MSEAATERYLVVGLGNPGRQYRGNRHNIGFLVVDQLAEKYGLRSRKVQHKAIVGNGRIMDRPVILAKPQTFMNRSGDSVGPLLNYYKIPAANLMVVYDELDIPFGQLRLRPKGGAGGHNGMRSIIQHVGNDFPRLRMGIGRPPGRMPPAAYVLQDFGKGERPVVLEMLDMGVAAIETYLSEGINLAMNRYNGTVENKEK